MSRLMNRVIDANRIIDANWGVGSGWLLRTIVAGCGLALVACGLAFLGGSPLGWGASATVVALVAGVALTLRRPESGASAAVLALLGGWWLVAGEATLLWQAALTGLVALAFHTTCSWAAATPAHTHLATRTWAWLGRRLGALVGVSALALLLVLGSLALPTTGSPYLTLGAVALLCVGLAVAAWVRGRTARADETADETALDSGSADAAG